MYSYMTSMLVFSLAEASSRSSPELMRLPENTVVPLQGQASFSCVASGNPHPEIQWFRNNVTLPGETGPMLVIMEVSLSDRGLYHCSATNAVGAETSSPAVLGIQGIYQYSVPVSISARVPGGPFIAGDMPSNEVIATISGIVDRLSVEAAGSNVGMFVLYNVSTVGDITTVSSTK